MAVLTRDGLDPANINLAAIGQELLSAKAENRDPLLPEGWRGFKSLNTISAHYRDGSASREAFFVPVVTLWSGTGEVRNTGFTRHPLGTCGYCGYPHDDLGECPSCGGT